MRFDPFSGPAWDLTKHYTREFIFWKSVKDHQINSPQSFNRFYRVLTKNIYKNDQVIIFNVSNRPVGRGEYQGIKYNDDSLYPYRGFYFEIEEYLLLPDEEKDHKAGVIHNLVRTTNRNLPISLDSLRKKQIFQLCRIFLIPSGQTDNEKIRKWMEAQLCSIFEHLHRLRKAGSRYIVCAFRINQNIPLPTIVICGGHKSFWGFYSSWEELAKGQPNEVALEVYHGTIRRVRAQYINKLWNLNEMVHIKDQKQVYWKDLAALGGDLFKSIKGELAKKIQDPDTELSDLLQ